MTDEKPSLAPHVEEAVQAIAKMHRAHQLEASAIQRFTDRTIAIVGRPGTMFVIGGFIAVWILATKFAKRFGIASYDPYPYPLLDLIITTTAIAIAVLILASQRRADRLGLLREQMTLELALLTEHKASKIIQLLEELRRDLPDVHDRHDPEALEMASKPDHETVLTVIDQAANRQDQGGE